jgi:hypothetical protein
MSKKRCEKKNYKEPDDPKYVCKKCGRKADKKDKVCKPEKL